MEAEEFVEKAIQLVYVDENGKYCVHPEGKQFIQKVPKPLGIISVAGLYRTGKSYLLNRILLNRNSGFGVGPTINPCTKGLWCWGSPIKGTTPDGEKVNVIIIDSEGIGALDEDQNHDTKIFTLAILCSSTFIYNSVGSIDQNALQNLSLVVNLTKSIQLKSNSADEEDDPEQLASYFPTFYWVVRDFTLTLVDADNQPITAKQYLEKALAEQKGFTDDIFQKNRIRRHLSAFFKERECVTLVRPVIGEQQLQKLEKCTFEELRPQFVEQSLSFRRKVLSKIKVKTINGEKLNGNMYVSLLDSYVSSINEGGIPNIQNAWTYMCNEKSEKVLESSYEYFLTQTKKQFEENLPCSIEEFDAISQNIEEESILMFEAQAIGESSKTLKIELLKMIKKRVNELKTLNMKESRSFLRKYAQKCYQPIEKKLRMGECNFYQDYIKSANGVYVQMMEAGPNLPDRETVYQEYLRRVSQLGAEYFLKLSESALVKVNSLAEQKQKLYKQNLLEVKEAADEQVSMKKEQMRKLEYEQKCKLEEREEELKSMKQVSEKAICKLQESIKLIRSESSAKINNLENQNDQLSQKYQKKEQELSQIIKENQKCKALANLQYSRLKEEFEQLKLIEMSNTINYQKNNSKHALEIQELQNEFQSKTYQFMLQKKKMNEDLAESIQAKELCSFKLEEMQLQFTAFKKKSQEETQVKQSRIEREKHELERVKDNEISELNSQIESFEAKIKQYRQREEKIEKQIRQFSEKTKSASKEDEKQKAILSQKLQFLEEELRESSQRKDKLTEYYELKIKSLEEKHREECLKIENSFACEMKDRQNSEVWKAKEELAVQAEEYQRQVQQTIHLHRVQLSTLNQEIQSYQAELFNKNSLISNLEASMNYLREKVEEKQQLNNKKSNEKQQYYIHKVKCLELEIEEFGQERERQKREYYNEVTLELNNLKSYYELEKQKLEAKIKNDREKYEKKIDRLKQQHEAKVEEETMSLISENESLKDELLNQTTLLKDTIVQLEHEKDIKSKTISNLEEKYQDEKLKFELKLQEFIKNEEKAESNWRRSKEIFDDKIRENDLIKNKLEKQLLVESMKSQEFFTQMGEHQRIFELKNEEHGQIVKAYEKQIKQIYKEISQNQSSFMDEKINYEKRIALIEQEKEFLSIKMSENEKHKSVSVNGLEEKISKVTEESNALLKQVEDKCKQELVLLEEKYQKLKKNSKFNEEKLNCKIESLEKEILSQAEKIQLVEENSKRIEEKKNTEITLMNKDLSALKMKYQRCEKEAMEEEQTLKLNFANLENERHQIDSSYERDKVLWQNKFAYLEESKEKHKKQFAEALSRIEKQLEISERLRNQDKHYYEKNYNEQMTRLEKKYKQNIEDIQDNFKSKEAEADNTKKQISLELRLMTEKLTMESQQKKENQIIYDRKVKELTENLKKAQEDFDRIKLNNKSSSEDIITIIEKQKQNYKTKLLDKQEKLKKAEKSRQDLYYELEKQKAKWNLEKQNFSIKSDELKDLISKYQRDLEKLQRENEKLKVEKKCSKFQSNNYSRYSIDRSSNKSINLEESLSSLSMSFQKDKENFNPLDSYEFFNNQQ